MWYEKLTLVTSSFDLTGCRNIFFHSGDELHQGLFKKMKKYYQKAPTGLSLVISRPAVCIFMIMYKNTDMYVNCDIFLFIFIILLNKTNSDE